MTARPLTAQEQAILDLLLQRDFPGRDELVVQARSVQTCGSSCDCGCPSFSLVPDRSLPASPAKGMPTEAHGVDPGGNQIGVLLFVNDGYLFDVEVFGYDPGTFYEPGTFAGLPDAAELKLSEWSDPDDGGARHLLNS